MADNELTVIFQSTLSVRRATSPTGVLVVGLDISIHALRKESDMVVNNGATLAMAFQSTLSVRRATGWPRASPKGIMNFNPRSP